MLIPHMSVTCMAYGSFNHSSFTCGSFFVIPIWEGFFPMKCWECLEDSKIFREKKQQGCFPRKSTKPTNQPNQPNQPTQYFPTNYSNPTYTPPSLTACPPKFKWWEGKITFLFGVRELFRGYELLNFQVGIFLCVFFRRKCTPRQTDRDCQPPPLLQVPPRAKNWRGGNGCTFSSVQKKSFVSKGYSRRATKVTTYFHGVKWVGAISVGWNFHPSEKPIHFRPFIIFITIAFAGPTL